MQIAQYLQKYKRISSIERVEDSTIKVVFDRFKALFFDLKRGDSYVFMKDNFKKSKIYKAPFDIVLSKKFTNSVVENISVLKDDRILQIKVISNSKYKSENSILQLEFTGKNTNAIILDKDAIVQEALRHIDISTTYREVKVGTALKDLVKEQKFIPKSVVEIENIENFLENEYLKRVKVKLSSLKKQKILNTQKKIKKFQKILDSLENEESLLKKSEKFSLWATLLFSNINKIKGYQKEVELDDFQGNKIKITIPGESRSVSEAGNKLYANAKKLKKKAKSLYIERENLNEKIDFLKKLQNAIEHSEDEAEVNILLPKQKHSKKIKGKPVSYESFFMEGFKIMLGKNEKGNIQLLKSAKKRDIWLHLKDISSTHVIIRTDKQNIPLDVLEFGAKLCVEFSVVQQGSYLVDYTQRRNVKMGEGAHVNYVDYKTIRVKKD